MRFFVHVDLLGGESPGVHQETCRCVSGRRPRTTTTRWYGPFTAAQAHLVSKREAGKRGVVRDAPRCCGGLRRRPPPLVDVGLGEGELEVAAVTG